MKYLWNVEIEDIIEAQKLAKNRGKQPGDSYEIEFLEVMENKNKKPFGATELNKEEYIAEQITHGKNILDIVTDSEGVAKIRVIKKPNIEEA